MLNFKSQNSHNGIVYNKAAQKRAVWMEGRVPYLSFPSLKEIDFVGHGFSTRLGGVSKDHLSSMNLSYTRGDNPDSVTENYIRIAKALQFHTENLVLSDQIHGVDIATVTEKDRQGEDLLNKRLRDIDGLITNVPDTVLATSYADCVPLFFVDKKERAIGLSHSGWRGTVGEIGRHTIEKMRKEFSSKPENIMVVIGPSICRDCYEVSREVAEAFYDILSKEQKALVLEQTSLETYQLDLWLANRFILENAGVPLENISISEVCTCCNPQLLYSHRASKGQRGNLSAFLWLKS